MLYKLNDLVVNPKRLNINFQYREMLKSSYTFIVNVITCKCYLPSSNKLPIVCKCYRTCKIDIHKM